VSQENVELVRAAYSAVVGDEWDLAVDLLDPEVELHGTVGGLEEGTVARGIEQIRHGFQEEEPEAWDEIRYRPEKFIGAGNQVVVLQHEFRRGRGSGVEVEIDTAAIFEIRNGRVVRIQGYIDRAEALKAAGLSE
jgi:ketosteroid isomerase-like protein